MPQPNIVCILTDHFRPDALGPDTPNLLSLAARGVKFENAYCAAPLCQPSRVSLITGLLPSQHGVCGNQSDPVSADLRDQTFMRCLQQAGYHTALIGKHHYIDRYGLGVDVRQDDEELRSYGFNSVHQVVDDGENQHNDDEYTSYLGDADLLNEFRSSFSECTASGRHPFPEDDTADGYIGSRAVEWLQGYDREQPFYINVGFVGPHPPYWFPGEPTVDPATCAAPLAADDTRETRLRRARYREKIRLIDRYAGRIVSALKDINKLSDTVIVFSSDHGDCLGDYGVWDKRHFYEQSAGVPLLVAGPGIAGGVRRNGPRMSRALVSHLDIYPTILDLAQADAASSHARRGRSLAEIPAGSTAPPPHDAVFAELATSTMIRTAQWKLVFDPEQGGVIELFNLRSDPNELQNLSGAPGYEPVTARLIERLLSERILRTQFTHVKEEQRLQRVRV